MSLTPAERDELARLEAAFAENGSRGVDLAERIDALRAKATPFPIRVEIHYVAVANDITDELGWQLGAMAAICFESCRPGERAAATSVLEDVIFGSDLYEIVNRQEPTE